MGFDDIELVEVEYLIRVGDRLFINEELMGGAA